MTKSSLRRREMLVRLAATAVTGCAARHLPPTPQLPKEPPPEDLASFLEPIRRQFDIPAMGAAIVAEGRIVAIGVTGSRRRGSPDPVQLTDPWHLGSCTKAMTATLVARLVEQGKLTFDTKLRDFPFEIATLAPEWSDVTIDQLLRHRSGAAETLSSKQRRTLRPLDNDPRSARAALVRELLTAPPISPPGRTTRYSNLGYAIVGHAIETRLDRAFEHVMRDEVFTPLGMTQSGFGAPGRHAIDSVPWGHNASGKPVSPDGISDNPAAIWPAAGIHSTLEEWARFVSVHEGSGPRDYLRPETLTRLHTPTPNDTQRYSAGWIVGFQGWAKGTREGDVGRVLTHTGSNLLWCARASVAPERKRVIVMVTNAPDKLSRMALAQEEVDLTQSTYIR